MSKKNKNEAIEVEQTLGEAVGKTEQFIEKNQKNILVALAVLALIVVGVIAVRNLYLQPREIQAENAMYKAQAYFAVDSFQLALKGNAEVVGFEQIVADYGMTKSGNLSQAYAGICEYKLGNYENAIKLLSQYDVEDNYFKTAIIGTIGDCYAELNQPDKAQNYYKKAIADKNDVSPIYLKKSGILYELNGDKEKATQRYQAIQDDYPMSNEAYDIEKYIGRVEG